MELRPYDEMPLRVLCLEDSRPDAEIIRESLVDAGFDLTFDCAVNEQEFNDFLHHATYDIVLSDFNLPGFDAFGSLRTTLNTCPDVPFICVSGSIGEEIAIELIKSGAVDYILKDRLGRLPSAISRALNEVREKVSRRRAEESLRESEEHYRTLIETTPDAIAIIDRAATITFASAKVLTVFGIPSDEILVGMSLNRLVHANDHGTLEKRLHDTFAHRAEPEVREYFLLKFDGTPFWGEVSTAPLLDALGNVEGLLMLCRDITEKKKLLEELTQSQKIQSLGRLAGGIAHDFNNILGIILAYTSMMEHAPMTPEKYTERFAAIESAVRRGSSLVRQILTFARKTDSLFEPMSLPELLHELIPMLRQTFPKTITFNEKIRKDVPYFMADRTQIHQALLNLCVNARDAMPHGGSITLTVEMQPGARVRERFADADQAGYLAIAVADTGEGMTEVTRAKIFDPFFTTKERGKGTGLGLSVVFGIVQAHHGFIEVDSTLGTGTTFTLYLPAQAHEEPSTVGQKDTMASAAGGTETILLIEDERYLLEMMRMRLESNGYRVYCAEEGHEAVELYRRHRDAIHLIVSDMGLPGLTGPDVFRMIKQFDPGVKVIFASGYIDPDVKAGLLNDGVKEFVQKPYTANEILRKIRDVLDAH